MRIKMFFLTSVLLAGLNPANSFAEEKQVPSHSGIPFITYDTQFLVATMATSNKISEPIPATNLSVINEVAPETIEALIKKIRTTVCHTAGNADVKVWFSFDASGKILGVGAAAQSGLEVTFHCK